MTAQPDVGGVAQVLGITLDDELGVLALTHRSYAFEAGGLPTNERLEFLGDAVLGLVVTDEIYRRFPDAPEGRLAKIRAAAVNTQSLAELARSPSPSDRASSARLWVLTAAATELIRRLFGDLLDDLSKRRASLDYKTSLQELTAAQLSSLPVYELTEEGPDHEKRFTAVVVVEDEPVGRGEGRSKKEAEQAAARQAYDELVARLAVVSPPHDRSD